MSQPNHFESQVRHALHIEAEAGPDYRDTLHASVMQRITQVATEEHASALSTRPIVPTVFVVIVFVVVAIIVAVAMTR